MEVPELIADLNSKLLDDRISIPRREWLTDLLRTLVKSESGWVFDEEAGIAHRVRPVRIKARGVSLVPRRKKTVGMS